MLCSVRSLGLTGLNGYEVQVECYISNGLPGFDVVGLPDAAVKEARDRVRAAVKNCGFRFPVSRITLNLAPAGTKNRVPSMICPFCWAFWRPRTALNCRGSRRRFWGS